MVDLQLKVVSPANDEIFASYTCPCGCNPGVALRRGSELATEGCCCGNEFAVGPHAAGHIVDRQYAARPGFELKIQSFQAPWGEPIEAAWAVGDSQHPVEGGHGHAHHDHGDMPAGRAVDPVCGMSVDVEAATGKGLHFTHVGTDYYFCGRGCRLDFEEDPGRYLDPSYVPSM
jgi:YHS domain-containing protein